MIKLVKPSFWSKRTGLSLVLSPIGYLYYFIYLIYKFFITPYQSKTKVVCVGSPVMGGSGKTPVCISIFNILSPYYNKICFLSKGYGGRIKLPTKVDLTIHNAIDVGDEALLLAKYSDSFIAYSRADGIKFIENDYDLIIIDDGLQNVHFNKNIKIVVIDSYYGFGNKLLFPAGPLKEPLSSSISSADIIINIGDNKSKLKGSHQATINLISKPIANQKYLAFTGIAYPEKFYQTLLENNFSIAQTKSFPDHYNFLTSEIEGLIAEAKNQQLYLITTEKDSVRISDKFLKEIIIARMNLNIQDEEKIKQILKNKLLS